MLDAARDGKRRRAIYPDRSYIALSEYWIALQNTGRRDLRQSQFVDTRYTLGYTSWFLSERCNMFAQRRLG